MVGMLPHKHIAVEMVGFINRRYPHDWGDAQFPPPSSPLTPNPAQQDKPKVNPVKTVRLQQQGASVFVSVGLRSVHGLQTVPSRSAVVSNSKQGVLYPNRLPRFEGGYFLTAGINPLNSRTNTEGTCRENRHKTTSDQRSLTFHRVVVTPSPVVARGLSGLSSSATQRHSLCTVRGGGFNL